MSQRDFPGDRQAQSGALGLGREKRLEQMADHLFFEYLKVGVPLTLFTTLAGVAWLSVVAH